MLLVDGGGFTGNNACNPAYFPLIPFTSALPLHTPSEAVYVTAGAFISKCCHFALKAFMEKKKELNIRRSQDKRVCVCVAVVSADFSRRDPTCSNVCWTQSCLLFLALTVNSEPKLLISTFFLCVKSEKES